MQPFVYILFFFQINGGKNHRGDSNPPLPLRLVFRLAVR